MEELGADDMPVASVVVTAQDALRYARSKMKNEPSLLILTSMAARATSDV